jgi:hypothetical protein
MSRRAVAAILAALVVVAACSGPAGPSGSMSASPVETDVEGAVGDQAALHGSRVAVRGFLLIEQGRARLCAVVMVSYPPQCGGATILIRGGIPQAFLDQLESTADEPRLAPAAWGDVIATGTLLADGAGGPPVIELGSITLAHAA